MTTKTMIKIGDLPSAIVFAALYNNAVVRGFGFRLQMDGTMTVHQAQSLLSEDGPFVHEWGGRVIKINFSHEEFDPTEYDDANHGGEPMAEQIVDHIREKLKPELVAELTRDFWRKPGPIRPQPFEVEE